MTPKPRRRRLVEKGGVEMFEVRVVQWFDPNGKKWTSVEATTPDGSVPDTDDAISALELGKLALWEANMERQAER